MQLVLGIVIGVFFGFLVRPVLDLYMVWRAQEEYRATPLDVVASDPFRADADLRP